MTLRNGKFYDGDTLVPLQFGNQDQIDLINAVKQLKDEGAVPAFVLDDTQKVICGLRLTCVCGSIIQCDWKTQDEGEDIEGTTVKCGGCDFTYKVCADEYDFHFFKLVK